MPFKAVVEGSNKAVFAWDVARLPIRVIRGMRFRCPFCGGELLFVNARERVKHFRHKVRCPYETEPETPEHLMMKREVYRWLSRLYGSADVEVRIGSSVADVVSRRLVVEVQYSNIDFSTFLKRMREHSENGYYTLWLFHKKFIEWEKWFLIRAKARRFLLFLNNAFIYFMDPETSRIGVYKVRKRSDGYDLDGFRYAVVGEVWAPIDEFLITYYTKETAFGKLRVARPYLRVTPYIKHKV